VIYYDLEALFMMNRENPDDYIRTEGSIVDPSLDDILENVENPHYAINMTIKRCRQLNLAEESEKAGSYITTAKLITRVFQEMSDGDLLYEKIDQSQKKLKLI